MADIVDPNAVPPELAGLPPLGPMPNKAGLSLWFGRVHRELGEIEEDIEAKDGFLFLKTHTHSKSELRKHPSFQLIEALVDQIGHTVGLWEHEGKLTGPERKLYIESRSAVEVQTSELRRRIAARKNTVLEGVTHFFRYIMEKLPDLIVTLVIETGKQLLGLPSSPAGSRKRIERQAVDRDWED